MEAPKEFVISKHSNTIILLFDADCIEKRNKLRTYCQKSRHILLYFEAANYEVVLVKVSDGVDYYKAMASIYEDFENEGFEPLPDINEIFFSVIEIPDCETSSVIYNKDAEYPF